MILTLCGSLRYEDYFHEASKQLVLAGHICFSTTTFPSVEFAYNWYTEDQKRTMDMAHLAKIEESDGVVMLNIEGYLGESSLRELKWARMRNKHIFWAFRDGRKISDPGFGSIERMAQMLINRTAGDWNKLLQAVDKKREIRAVESERLIPR